MRKISLSKVFALAQVLGRVTLKGVDTSDKFKVVRLVAELQQHVDSINVLRQKAAMLDEAERADFLNAEGEKEVELENTITEETVQRIIDNNDELTAGQLTCLLWIV